MGFGRNNFTGDPRLSDEGADIDAVAFCPISNPTKAPTAEIVTALNNFFIGHALSYYQFATI